MQGFSRRLLPSAEMEWRIEPSHRSHLRLFIDVLALDDFQKFLSQEGASHWRRAGMLAREPLFRRDLSKARVMFCFMNVQGQFTRKKRERPERAR